MSVEQITENVYVIYPGAGPRRLLNYNHYRGNAFSLTLIGKNVDDTPFDFSVFSDFWMQFREKPKNEEIIAELGSSNFILGKTEVGQAEFDELHIYDPTGEILKLPQRYLFTDVKVNDIGEDSQFLVHFILLNTFNVTRLT